MTRPARTLSDVLAGLDADQLAELIANRPDLGYPVPRHLTDLAAAATSATSVQRAIAGLTAWQVAVTKALAIRPDPADAAAVATLLGSAEEPVRDGLADLRRIALLWGDDEHLHLVRAARDQFGTYPGGLAPPSADPLSPDEIASAIAACGPDVRPILQRLTWGPPTGSVTGADRQVRVADARTPVEQLLARRLLRPLDRDTVILAQEVALWLRSQESAWLLDGDPVGPEPPEPWGRIRSERASTQAAVGAAQELNHDLEQLLAGVDADPPRLLRDGGISVRDVRTMSRQFNNNTAYTSFLLECGAAAGLLSNRDEPYALPTPQWDHWLTLPTPDRWQALAQAWRDGTRWFGAPPESGTGEGAGESDSSEAENRPQQSRPLAGDHAPQAARIRAVLVELSADAPAGSVPDIDILTAAVAWRLPAADRDRDHLRRLVGLVWQQAEWLGLVALSGTTALLPVLRGDAAMPATLRRLFPEPVQEVIIQSDLTAVAQGPLESGTAQVFRLLADQESRGGGAVFRFTQTSLRRAFDAGWSGTDISEWLNRHSTTGIPQPLRYLIDDVARQHGAVRVGGTASYVRIDDPAQQAAVTSHPDAAELQLRAIAPGVLVSPADPDEVVTLLRRIGLQPAAEDANQQLLTTRARRRARQPHRTGGDQPSTDPRQVAEAVLAAEQRMPPATDVSDDVDRLRQAAETGTTVRISLVDRRGSATEHAIVPLAVDDGTLRARPADASTEAAEWAMPIWQLRLIDSGQPPT